MYVSQSVSESAFSDSIDVTLVSEDTYGDDDEDEDLVHLFQLIHLLQLIHLIHCFI